MGYAADNVGFFDHGAANHGPDGPRGPDPASDAANVLPLRPAVDRALLAFPAGLLGHLPLPVGLDVGVLNGLRFSVILDDAEAQRRREAGERILDAADWEVLVTATESDRLRAIDLPALLAARREGPLMLEQVLGGALPDPARGWSLARVLSRLGLVVHGAAIIDRRENSERHAA